MSLCSPHTHPCKTCKAPVACDGALERNDDGWPDVICDVYHAPGGEVRAPECDGCLDTRGLAGESADEE